MRRTFHLQATANIYQLSKWSDLYKVSDSAVTFLEYEHLKPKDAYFFSNPCGWRGRNKIQISPIHHISIDLGSHCQPLAGSEDCINAKAFETRFVFLSVNDRMLGTMLPSKYKSFFFIYLACFTVYVFWDQLLCSWQVTINYRVKRFVRISRKPFDGHSVNPVPTDALEKWATNLF